MHKAWLSTLLVLGVFGGSVTGVAGCANSSGARCEGESPNPTYLCCETGTGPAWIDIYNDPRNCGGCGTACGVGGVCRAGRCEGGGGDGGMIIPGTDGGPPGMCSPSCSSSQRCCGTQCISRSGVAIGTDGRSDPTFMNCTACGAACDPDRASACSVPGGGTGTPRCMCGVFDQCAAGQMCLRSGTDFACVNLSTDPMNCGSPGHACAMGESCVAGECRCGSGGACTTGQSCCGGACIDTSSDAMNCGGCGTVCAGGETCQGGSCVCGSGAGARACVAPTATSTGEICCGGTCVAQDASNCGGCGVTCDASSGEECVVGSGFGGGSTMVCCGMPSPLPGLPAFCFGGGLGDGGFGLGDGGFPFP